MNQYHKDYRTSILRVCEKLETIARIGIQQGLLSRPSDFFHYLPNFRSEIRRIKTNEGFQSNYARWGARELNTLTKQVCGKVCSRRSDIGCNTDHIPIIVQECTNCPIFCYRETFGSGEDRLTAK